MTPKRKRHIAISGGIGSGKSVVCRILTAMGMPVYDCDCRAKNLMDSSLAIKNRIASEICREAIDADGNIDRAALANKVFNDRCALSALNSIVHQAVKDDYLSWRNDEAFPDCVFIETARLYQSGIDQLVDEVWEVTAPVDVRVRRVMSRNNITEAEVLKRIKSQDSYIPESMHGCVRKIINDGTVPVLPQIEDSLNSSASAQGLNRTRS